MEGTGDFMSSEDGQQMSGSWVHGKWRSDGSENVQFVLEVWPWKARGRWSNSRTVWGPGMKGLALVGFCFLSNSMLSKAEYSTLSLPGLLSTAWLPPPKRNAILMDTHAYVTPSVAHFQNIALGQKREKWLLLFCLPFPIFSRKLLFF